MTSGLLAYHCNVILNELSEQQGRGRIVQITQTPGSNRGVAPMLAWGAEIAAGDTGEPRRPEALLEGSGSMPPFELL